MSGLIAAFVTSLLVCEIVRRFALRRALLDAPNARSLHVTPTPRLGGVGIVVTTCAFGIGATTESPRAQLLLALAASLALIGLRDDVRPLSSGLRFALQIALSVVFLSLAGVPTFELAPGIVLPLPAIVTGAALVVWMIGVLNIYNFMDGIDGLAGVQTIGAAISLAVIHGPGGLERPLLLLAAAGLGFLAHNFPPARMFLGDAGSYFIGTMFAATAVVGMHSGISIAESALPFAPFLLDGTFTILRRAARGEKVWQAHRSHLYQRAVQTGLAHREVLLAYLVWIGSTAAAAAFAGHLFARVVAGWALTLVGFGVVWRWVVERESQRGALP